METKGKLVTCDRCGRKIFLRHTGKGDADGGYTVWDKYEPLPETWLSTTQIGTLCNVCGGIFRCFICKFMGDKLVAPVWALKEGDALYGYGVIVPPVEPVEEEYIEQI